MWILLRIILYPVGYVVLRYGLLLEKRDIEKMGDGRGLAGLIGLIIIGLIAYFLWIVIL